MDNYIIMSQKEIDKYDIIKKLIKKEINGTDASNLLNITTRHVRRLKRNVEKNGIKGLIHGNRNKQGNRQIPEKEKQKIIKLLHEKYYDFGPLLASEKLAENHNISRNKETIRSIMIKEKLWKPKIKKVKEYRSLRRRKDNVGEMIQYDGSYERWFEDRNDKCCLLLSIDDATSQIYAKFDEHEGVTPTFNFWREYMEKFGKPVSIYVDRFSTYSMNHKLAKENPDTLTQFERAMKELNVDVIHAKTPQAKGRVENIFKTLQDRLIKELRLKNISTIEESNKFLINDFLPKFNRKFNVEPKRNANFHRQLTKQEIGKLDSIFSRHDERIIKNDFTIMFDTKYFQLLKDQPVTICKKDKVIVETWTDNSINIKLKGKYLNYEILSKQPQKRKEIIPWVIAKTSVHSPAKDHPWRKFKYSNKSNLMSK